MDFLPMPHKVEKKEGCFHLAWNTPIVLVNCEPSAFLYARMLQEKVQKYTGLELRILKGAPDGACVTLTEDPALPEDHYILEVAEKGIAVRGGSDEAILHGVMTLSQWIHRHGAILPALLVEDWPDLAHRGYYLDVSRGRIPTLETLKKYADLLCEYKINEWQLYIEHTYLFRNLSEAWRDDEPLEAEDILELDRYCRERHIELVPSLSTFGHMYMILATKTCEEFCELEGASAQPFAYTEAGWHHTINVSNPGAMDFVKGLIDEYRQLFTSRKFNICCDETFDLCRGKSREMEEQKHEKYLNHVVELCRYLLDQGITPMFWGDMLYRHPETYDAIPKGVICLNWGYAANQGETEIRDLASMGAVQYACPGVATWNMILPCLTGSFSNIRAMCHHAHKYGAIGLLNTDWGDWGHVCHPFFSVPGILYGAAFSWNAGDVPMEEMNDAISFHHYGDATGSFMRAFVDMTGNEAFSWTMAVRWMEHVRNTREEILKESLPSMVKGRENNEKMDAALRSLDAAAQTMDPAERWIVHALHVSAEGVKLLNEIGLYIACRDGGEKTDCRDPYALAAGLEKWYHEYVRIWHTISRHGTLERTRKLIDGYADELRGRVMQEKTTML
ncbi:MAG: family 20 glycosylhydrolase [Clostridia bacterium]|nr:family 20 glycosylhydrolase [Clostridia bacterium]